MTNSRHIVVAGARRIWSPEQKRAILAEADDPATTASEVARRHGLHSSLLFRWRHAVLAEQQASTGTAPPTFIPLAQPPPPTATADVPAGSGLIEIELSDGHRGRAATGADLTLLQGAIAALLMRAFDDGRLALDNNAAERALRCVAVGRENDLFAGSELGAERAAAFDTLIETAKMNGLDPEGYLRDVLTRIADYPAKRLADLLPWNWMPTGGAEQAA